MKIIQERIQCHDGTATMKVIYDDGGRAYSGYKGKAGDCVVRSVAIATGKSYQDVYDDLRELNSKFSQSKRSRIAKRIQKKGATPRDGNFKDIYHPYLESLGWSWVPTMKIGSGCKVHLCEGELPSGRLIVKVTKHLVAVIDNVIYDTYDPQRATINDNKITHRCVYGYFVKEAVCKNMR